MVLDERRWAWSDNAACLGPGDDDCRVEKAHASLELIERMWDAYMDRPKFAYLNAIAAQVYAPQPGQVDPVSRALRRSHDVLLEQMLSRAEDYPDTIVVVRSDHGLQYDDRRSPRRTPQWSGA